MRCDLKLQGQEKPLWRAAGHANRQVWAHEAPLSERTPEKAVYQPAPNGKTLSSFVEDWQDRQWANGYSYATVDEDRRCDRGTKSSRPDEMGGAGK